METLEKRLTKQAALIQKQADGFRRTNKPQKRAQMSRESALI